MKAKLYKHRKSGGDRELVAESPIKNLWPVLSNVRHDGHGELYPPGPHLLVCFEAQRERFTAEFTVDDAKALFTACAEFLEKHDPERIKAKAARHPHDCQCERCLEDKSFQYYLSNCHP